MNGNKVADFYSADSGVSAGFFKSVVNSTTGAYVLTGNEYTTSTGLTDSSTVAIIYDATAAYVYVVG